MFVISLQRKPPKEKLSPTCVKRRNSRLGFSQIPSATASIYLSTGLRLL
jgi:hypothetical protein